MCSRYTASAEARAVAERFGLAPAPGLRPRWNAAPGQELGAALAAPAPRLAMLRWGLLPSWAKPGAEPAINARAESLADKPYFRDAFRWRRCLIPADGWYEKPKKGADRALRHIRLKGGGLFAFAGLWEPGGFAIVTVPPNPLIARVHERMPLLLPADAEKAWLDSKTAPDALRELLRPFPSERLEMRRVSERAAQSAADEPSLIEELRQAQGDLFGPV